MYLHSSAGLYHAGCEYGATMTNVSLGTLFPGKIVAQANDRNGLVRSKTHESAVSGDDHMGVSSESAFQNSVVGVVGGHFQSSPWSDALTELVYEYRHACQLFAVATKLSREDAEEFVENLFRKDELVSTVDDPSDRLFSGSARKHERRNEDVRIEYDPHDVR